MSDPVHLTPSGPPETVLDPEPDAALAALESAMALPGPERRDGVSAVVAALAQVPRRLGPPGRACS